MTPGNLNGVETCAVCGRDAEGDRWFCHFYNGDERVTLCSTGCAEHYLHSPRNALAWHVMEPGATADELPVHTY
jgi:hypothetical protein